MKIKQKFLTCVVLGAGLVGAALSYIASTLEKDPGGLLQSGHPVYYVMCVLALGMLGYLFFALRDVKSIPPYNKLFPSGILSLVGCGAGAFGIAFNAGELLAQSPAPLGMATAVSGFLAAACLGFVGYCRYTRKRPHYIFHSIITIHLMILLIYRYQVWNTEPQLPLYLVQMMASLLLMLTFYQRAALDAGIGNRRDHAFCSYAAAFFCCLAVIDEMSVFHLAMTAWCLACQCSLVRVRDLPPMELPEEMAYCVQTLNDAGYSVYAVGGCVRDHLMGGTPADYDLCTSATPEEICDLFERHRLVRSGEQHGTIGVVVAGEVYEITTFRTEGEYSDTRHPDWVEFVTDINQDLARRDFTINAMAYHADEGFVDPFGGYPDLGNKVLRAVGDPETRFKEDALRILRGVRFSVRFGLTPEENTLKAMNDCAPLIQNLARERVSSELCKLLPLISTNQLMQYKNIMAQVVPALFPEEGEELYGKAITLVGRSEQDLTLRMTALLCPLGEEGADAVLQELRCSNALRNRVLLLIKLHSTPLTAEKKQLFQLLGDHGQEAVKQLLALQIATAKVHEEDLTELTAIGLIIDELCQGGSCLTAKELAVTGTDLLELGVTPGPQIGRCMQFLLSLVQDDILPNEKEELLAAAKNFFETEEDE